MLKHIYGTIWRFWNRSYRKIFFEFEKNFDLKKVLLAKAMIHWLHALTEIIFWVGTCRKHTGKIHHIKTFSFDPVLGQTRSNLEFTHHFLNCYLTARLAVKSVYATFRLNKQCRKSHWGKPLKEKIDMKFWEHFFFENSQNVHHLRRIITDLRDISRWKITENKPFLIKKVPQHIEMRFNW